MKFDLKTAGSVAVALAVPGGLIAAGVGLGIYLWRRRRKPAANPTNVEKGASP